MYDKINLFLPTYKRVHNGKLQRFLKSTIELCGNIDNVVVTFLVDPDDKETLNFLNNGYFKIPFNRKTLLWDGKKPHHGKMYNYIYDNTCFNGEHTVVSMVGDDMEFKTQDWDLKILKAVNDKKGMAVVYCNDDFVQGEKLCVNLFTTRKVVDYIGQPFMCELFPAYFIDTVWMEIGKKLKLLTYLKDVKLKHHHYTGDIKNIDETSKRLCAVRHAYKKGYPLVKKYVEETIRKRKPIRGIYVRVTV